MRCLTRITAGLLWVAMFSGLISDLKAQDRPDSSSFVIDSTHIELRSLSTETHQRISSDPVFQYQQTAQEPETLWAQILRSIIDLLNYLSQNRFVSLAFKFLFFLIFGLAIAALVNQLLGGTLSSVFSSGDSGETETMTLKEMNKTIPEYDTLLTEALAENRYHDAVRILYLKTLLRLRNAELIQWKPEKTNQDYMQELGSHRLAALFSKLTSYYEYVEYGDFPIERDTYSQVEELFAKFEQQAEASNE